MFSFFLSKQDDPMSASDRELVEAIKQLRTLKITESGVSIDPSEVADDPQFIKDRKEARELLSI